MVFQIAYSTETRTGYEEGGMPLRRGRHSYVASSEEGGGSVHSTYLHVFPADGRLPSGRAASASCTIEHKEAIEAIGASEIPVAREPMRDPGGITEYGGRH